MATKARSLMQLMRWHKPTGTILTLTPSLWTLSLHTANSCPTPDLKTCAIFTAGALVARGMGCTINDILDRKYDRQVERTKDRPLASGAISTKEALVSLGVQSCAGLYILCLNNTAVIKLGLLSGLMISSYPLFKRFTYWPQMMLALTINWGVPMGYAAVKGSVGIDDLPMFLPIYIGSICWTLLYDTVYAHQDKRDDSIIGVKSSALKLGAHTKRFLTAMNRCMLASLVLAGMQTDQTWPFYFALLSSGVYQARQIFTLNLDDPDQCWRVFDFQKYIGLIILIGALSSCALKYVEKKKDKPSENKS